MDSITGVIDMDGFTVEKTFYCKELALIKNDQTYATSILFDLGLNWNQLNEKDQKTARYLKKYIHMIRFNSPSTVPVSNLPQIVREYFSKPNTFGSLQRRTLRKRSTAPTGNAEQLNSPKAEQLFQKLGWLETCGHHLTPDAYHHCPKAEVEAFAMWLW